MFNCLFVWGFNYFCPASLRKEGKGKNKEKSEMIIFPNAKINLGLNITEKRDDGFHNIQSCFYPVQWNDVLEIIPAKKTIFKSSGIDIPGKPENNLCLKACQLLKKDFQLPNVEIYLHKIIPIGAGLGGGSADAAFALKALDQLFELYLDDFILEEYAEKIGSDCPFFIKNKPILALEKGTVFEAIDIDLTRKHIVLVYPNIHVSTAEAYAGVKPQKPLIDIKEIIENQPVNKWKDNLQNDFEDSIFPNHPQLSEIKNQLYALGASYASMSGSGSAIYGIFDEKPELENVFSKFMVWEGTLN